MFSNNQLRPSQFDDLFEGIFDNSELQPLDEDVQKTAQKCTEEGTWSSMIKLELKTKIQLQKAQKGENYEVEWREENENSDYQLTPEDLKKRKELKERNKLSARKHRMKKKEEKRQMTKEMEELSLRNASLKQQLTELELLKNKIFTSFGILPEENAA